MGIQPPPSGRDAPPVVEPPVVEPSDDEPFENVNPYASPNTDSPRPPLQGSYLDHYQGWLLLGILGLGFGIPGLVGIVLNDILFASDGIPQYGFLFVVGSASLAIWFLLNFAGRR